MFRQKIGKRYYRSSCPEVFCNKAVLKNFAKVTGKHLHQSLSLQLKKRLQHGCFPPNLVKFYNASFYRTPSVAAPIQKPKVHWFLKIYSTSGCLNPVIIKMCSVEYSSLSSLLIFNLLIKIAKGSTKQVFLKISLNSQVNTCVGVFLIQSGLYLGFESNFQGFFQCPILGVRNNICE